MSTIVGILKFATRTNGVGDCSEQDIFCLFVCFRWVWVLVNGGGGGVVCVFNIIIYFRLFFFFYIYLFFFVFDRLDGYKTLAQFIS